METRVVTDCGFIVVLLLFGLNGVDNFRVKWPKETRLQKDIAERFPSRASRDIWSAALYVAAHKYFGVDPRYATGLSDGSDYEFFKKFPTPPLRELHKDLASVCRDSVQSCLEMIVNKSYQSGTMWRFTESGETRKRRSFAPFKSPFDAFVFQQTAQYFMCWYMMKEHRVFFNYQTGRYPCLYDLQFVDQAPKNKLKEIEEKRRKNGIQPMKPSEYTYNIRKYFNVITDSRDKPVRPGRSFQCLRLMVCPDPCYGRRDGGNFYGDFNIFTRDWGNPCFILRDRRCVLNPADNTDLDGLIRNKFNISCNCNSTIRGFKWMNEYRVCVDIDECYEKKDNCPDNRICRNTRYSYECTCPRGYKAPSQTADCERTSLLSKNAKYLKYNPEDGEEENSFIDQVMIFLGLSYGTRISPCACLYMIIGALHLLLKSDID